MAQVALFKFAAMFNLHKVSQYGGHTQNTAANKNETMKQLWFAIIQLNYSQSETNSETHPEPQKRKKIVFSVTEYKKNRGFWKENVVFKSASVIIGQQIYGKTFLFILIHG